PADVLASAPMAQRRRALPDYDSLPTEAVNPRAKHLDALEPIQVVDLMVTEELGVPRAVRRERRHIAQAAMRVAGALEQGGRLIYCGAGTSGRLGNLDASECPPTFSVGYGTVVGVIAGGRRAITHAVEGAEDRAEEAAVRLRRLRVGPKDVV